MAAGLEWKSENPYFRPLLLLKRCFLVSLDKNEYRICAVFHKTWLTGGKRLDVGIFALKNINIRQRFQGRHPARNRRK